MIAVIGGVKTRVNIKMGMPERDLEKQRKQDEEALLQAGITMGEERNGAETDESPEDARFRQYYRAKMREQASENYWNEVGFGRKDFGGYPVMESSNAHIQVTSSGCSYTVAKQLGMKTEQPGEITFLSVVGTDALGLAAKCELEEAGVDLSGMKTVEGTTSISIEMHNIVGDLEFCRENNQLMNELTPDFVDENARILDAADVIFVDGSVPVETLNHLSGKYAGKSRIFFDPGSLGGGYAFAESELKAWCVLPGRMESEAMTGLPVLGLDQLMAAGEALEERGVEKTVITLKGGGLYYKDGSEAGLIKPERVLQFADTNGSGDVLTAELVYRMATGTSLKEAAESAMKETAEYLKDVEDIRAYGATEAK